MVRDAVDQERARLTAWQASIAMLRVRLSSSVEHRNLRLAMGYVWDAKEGRPLRLTRLEGLPYQLYVATSLPAYILLFNLAVLAHMALGLAEPPPRHAADSALLAAEGLLLLLFVADAAISFYQLGLLHLPTLLRVSDTMRRSALGPFATPEYAALMEGCCVLLLVLDWSLAIGLHAPIRVLRVVRPLMLFIKNNDAAVMLLTLLRTLPTFLRLALECGGVRVGP